MRFIAHRSTELRGLILTVDGQRFGFLTNGRFYSDDAELAQAVALVLRPKYSRNCALSTIKTAYLAYQESRQVIKDVEPAKPKRGTHPLPRRSTRQSTMTPSV